MSRRVEMHAGLRILRSKVKESMVFSGQHSDGSLERDERDLSFIVKWNSPLSVINSHRDFLFWH